MVTGPLKNPTFTAIIKLVAFIEENYICVVGGRWGVHDGIECLELCVFVRPGLALHILFVVSKIFLRLEDCTTSSTGMDSTDPIFNMTDPATFAVKDLLATRTCSTFGDIYRCC